MDNDFIGKIKLLESIDFINANEQKWLAIEVFNFSKQPWIATDSEQIKLAYHWTKISGEMVIWDGLRSPIPEAGIFPAQSVKTKMLVETPHAPGKYILNLTLVYESVAWFEHRGFEAEKITVQIPMNYPNINVLLIGNCQAVEIANILNTISAGMITATSICSTLEAINNIKSKTLDLAPLVHENDLILLHPEHGLYEFIVENFPKTRFKIRMIPRIVFSAFFPDLCQVVTKNQNVVSGVLGEYHSALVFFGWLNNFSVAETLNLFTADVFEYLGYYDYFPASNKFLNTESKMAGMPLDTLLDSWSKQGCWMYTYNHPKLFVLTELTEAILAREGIIVPPIQPSQIPDTLGNMCIWPVYPDIGKKLGIEGSYQFQISATASVSLEEFIEGSFKVFSNYNTNDLISSASVLSSFTKLKDFLKNRSLSNNSQIINNSNNEILLTNTINPYYNLPDYQFWRRAIEQVAIENVDPVVNATLTLSPNDKIATAGSCFAQHISNTLAKSGFNYYVPENGELFTLEEQQRRNFGVFSARFGNIYTSRQLLQLFERAYGTFIPTENYWHRQDNRLVDPFRPQIEPDGFASVIELEESKENHLFAVRQMFENFDVFIFTLGLTEAWRNKLDGAIYPLAPGVVAGTMDSNVYEFINLSVAEVVADMNQFIEKLLKINPKAKIILTVSPVPLIATYEKQHVLTATTYSKSVLRAAANEICQQNSICEYFPSYEIITGNYNRGQYFEKDLRSVTRTGVEHVMRLFLLNYTAKQFESDLETELDQQNILLSKIICDEEAINS